MSTKMGPGCDVCCTNLKEGQIARCEACQPLPTVMLGSKVSAVQDRDGYWVVTDLCVPGLRQRFRLSEGEFSYLLAAVDEAVGKALSDLRP